MRKSKLYREDYRQKNSAALIILIILLICSVVGALLFYINKDSTQQEITFVQQKDYSTGAVSAQKEAVNETPGIAFSLQTKEELNNDEYKTPLGFSIVSYSEKWKGDRLVEIYDELLKNVHGLEMNYISKVIVNPGGADNGTSEIDIAGTHTSKLQNYSVFFNLPALVPQSLKYKINRMLSEIELYNMDEFDSIQQASRTIAHEYGHHFTIFYFMQNDDAVFESEYYKLRNLANYEQADIFGSTAEYYANHEWSIYEIAAEDYVQLMGSPTAKQTKQYLDIQGVLRLKDSEGYLPEVSDTTVNVFPQENIYLPLADEINGLRDYYYSFIDAKNELGSTEHVDFGLSIKKSNKHYDITWTKTSTDKDALYTLVCYDKDGKNISPIKTVFGDEKPIATVGIASYTYGNTIKTGDDNITKKDRYFKLFLLLPDGRMQSSELFFVDF